METNTASANRQIARAAGTVMAAFIISNLVGLARDFLISGAFGASAETDAFYAANRLTELLFNLVAGGALASAFVPTFTGLLTHEDRQGAWKLASSIVNLILLILILVSILCAVFAPFIVREALYRLAPDQDPVQEGITVQLLRIQLISVSIFGVSGLVMGILNAHQRFLIPSIAPALYNLGWIFGALALAPKMGIYGLAWGVVIGAGLHLLVQVPTLLRLGGKYSFRLGLENPQVRQVARLMGPRLFGVAIVQINFIMNTVIAMSLPEGSNTAITYGWRLMLMPEMAIAQSVASAVLPTFSAQYARGQIDQIRASLAATLRSVLLLAIPASLGLVLLNRPIVSLFERGSFTVEDTTIVSWALLWYGLGLVGHCIVEILSRTFYALHDTRTPVMVGTVAMGLNIALSLIFSSWFAKIGWLPVGGLALANSLATGLEAAALTILIRKRLNGINGAFLLRGVGTSLLAGSAMGIFLLFWRLEMWNISKIGTALGGVVLGVGVYTAGMYLLKVPELYSLIAFVRRKLARA